jgi:peptidoglycan/LPS O-acetylase OafA/YrhL
MTHAVLAKILNASVFRGAPNPNAYVRFSEGLAYAVGIVLLAWLTHIYVETPSRILLRRRIAAEHPKSPNLAENGQVAHSISIR